MSRTYRRTKNKKSCRASFIKHDFCAVDYFIIDSLFYKGRYYSTCTTVHHDSDSNYYKEREREFHSDKLTPYGKRRKVLKELSKSVERTHTRQELRKVYLCEDYEDYDFSESYQSELRHLTWTVL